MLFRATDRACALQGLKCVGPVLDLQHEVDRWQMLLSAVQAYRVLGLMSARVPTLAGRLPLYEIIDRGDGRWVHATAFDATSRGLDSYLPLSLVHAHALWSPIEMHMWS